MALTITIYLDTSVINFLYADDVPEFKLATIRLFDEFIKTGVYKSFVSEYVVQEINNTLNEEKRTQLLSVIKDYNIPLIRTSKEREIAELAQLYVENKIIPAGKRTDALHIATTVINKIDFLVSWNFQHLANVNRERKVLALNLQNNYLHPLRIITPLQLMGADT